MELAPIPAHRRDAVRRSLDAIGAPSRGVDLVPIGGGASGAQLFALDTASGAHVLRVEGDRIPGRNPVQYECMAAAAAAEVAPAVRYLDADEGIVVMARLDTVPLTEFPGGDRPPSSRPPVS